MCVCGTHEFLLLASVLDLNVRFGVFAEDLKREVLQVGLHLSVSKLAANETLSIENAREKNMVLVTIIHR
jgi:hypothetical protein